MDLQHGKPREESLGRATETRSKGLGPTTARPAVVVVQHWDPRWGGTRRPLFPSAGTPRRPFPTVQN